LVKTVEYLLLVKDNSPYRSVIDGQQRITTILSFIRDEFFLKKPYDGEFLNKKFSDLPKEIQNSFLRYIPPINPANNSDTYSASPNLLLLVMVKTFASSKKGITANFSANLRKSPGKSDLLNRENLFGVMQRR
jgi:hypothetical protein